MDRREARIAAGAALVVAACMVFPVLLSPWRVLGAPRLEAENHLFLLWRTGESLLGHPGPWNNLPDGDRLWLQDWIHVPWFVILPFQPTLAWNLTALGDAWLAAFGGWLLAREAGADRYAAYAGMISLGLAPFLGGVLAFGLSEAWTLGWWAIHAAFLLRTARTGSAAAAVLGAVALAAFAASGWYSAAFALLGAPILLLWAWSRGTDRRGWALIVAQGAAAVVLVLPILYAFLHHSDVPDLVTRPVETWDFRGDWRVVPAGGADLLSSFVPPFRHISMSRTTYLGLAGVVVALSRPRRTWPMWAGILLFAVIAMGPYVQVLGWPVLGTAPVAPVAALTRLLPLFAAIGNWYRAGAIAAVLLSAAVAVALSGRPPRTIAIVCAVLAADALLLGEAPFPRPSYERDLPPQLRAVPGSGPLLLLPFDPAHGVAAHRAWQPLLRRPMADNYEGSTAIRRVPWVAWLESRCGSGKPPAWDAGPPGMRPSAEEITASVAEIWRTFEVVAALLPETRDPDGCLAELEPGFGPAERPVEGLAVWTRPR